MPYLSQWRYLLVGEEDELESRVVPLGVADK